MRNLNPWYNKTFVVILLLLFFFPIGLYALWKNEKATKTLKIVITLFFLIILILASKTEQKPVFDFNKQKEDELFDIVYSSERKIKDNLKDPSSYELIEKDYKFLNDTIYEINIRYSGTNGFGARIQNKYLKMGILKFNNSDSTFTNIVKFEQ